MISVQEVRRVVFRREIIEDYPEDARGRSWLMLGAGEGGRKIAWSALPGRNALPSLPRTFRKQTNGIRRNSDPAFQDVVRRWKAWCDKSELGRRPWPSY